MREFKFRAWDTEREVMARVNHLGLSDYEVRMEDNECVCWTAPHPYVCKLMQYIGLKDINNKDIYEGDIIRITVDGDSRKVGEVVYKDCGFYIHIPNKYFEDYHEITDTYKIEDMGGIINLKQSFEVIGNVYENPDFLK